MADKRLDQENVLTDFDYALIVKGADVAKISKADLAKVVGGLMPSQGLPFIGYRMVNPQQGRVYKLFSNPASWSPMYAVVEGMVNESPLWVFVSYMQKTQAECKCRGVDNGSISFYCNTEGAYIKVNGSGLNINITIRSCDKVADMGTIDTSGFTKVSVDTF